VSDLEALIELQAIDVRLTQLGHRLANLPELEEQATLVGSLADLDTRSGSVETEAGVVRREQRRNEDEVSNLEAKIANSERHLYDGGVTSPKEAQALQDEIAGLRRRKDEAEDRVLELMEQLEPLDAELGELSERRTALEDQADRVGARIAELSAEIETLTTEEESARRSLVEGIPADLVQVYEQRRRAMRGGVAISRLQGSSCGSCHLEISAVELEAIRALPANELGECPECGALVLP